MTIHVGVQQGPSTKTCNYLGEGRIFDGRSEAGLQLWTRWSVLRVVRLQASLLDPTQILPVYISAVGSFSGLYRGNHETAPDWTPSRGLNQHL